jgi:hypothetical protein
MTSQDLKAELTLRGISLKLADGTVKLVGPRRALTETFLQIARAHIAVLLDLAERCSQRPHETSPSENLLGTDRVIEEEEVFSMSASASRAHADCPPTVPRSTRTTRETGVTSLGDPAPPETSDIHDRRLDPSIESEIKLIEWEALRLGWTRDRLWNSRFWPHSFDHPRGLASILEAGDRIVEVTSDYIAIRRGDGRGTVQRFWKSH